MLPVIKAQHLQVLNAVQEDQIVVITQMGIPHIVRKDLIVAQQIQKNI